MGPSTPAEVNNTGLTTEQENNLLAQLKAVQTDLQQVYKQPHPGDPPSDASSAFDHTALAIALERHTDVSKLEAHTLKAEVYDPNQISTWMHHALHSAIRKEAEVSAAEVNRKISEKMHAATQHWDRVAAALSQGLSDVVASEVGAIPQSLQAHMGNRYVSDSVTEVNRRSTEKEHSGTHHWARQ